jgi:hypothetical protein
MTENEIFSVERYQLPPPRVTTIITAIKVAIFETILVSLMVSLCDHLLRLHVGIHVPYPPLTGLKIELCFHDNIACWDKTHYMLSSVAFAFFAFFPESKPMDSAFLFDFGLSAGGSRPLFKVETIKDSLLNISAEAVE